MRPLEIRVAPARALQIQISVPSVTAGMVTARQTKEAADWVVPEAAEAEAAEAVVEAEAEAVAAVAAVAAAVVAPGGPARRVAQATQPSPIPR